MFLFFCFISNFRVLDLNGRLSQLLTFTLIPVVLYRSFLSPTDCCENFSQLLHKYWCSFDVAFSKETYMTESTWPKEYDWNLINKIKYLRWQTLKYEYDQMLTFVGVKFFRSCSNQILVILIRLSELASLFLLYFIYLLFKIFSLRIPQIVVKLFYPVKNLSEIWCLLSTQL